VYDGTEIIEATSAIIHLSKRKANVSFYAPNIEQMHVINHLNGDVQAEVR
jgi:enhancing lycopene biosynthesis protein 2